MRRGFTLVELSIVLVIVGLLIGGILAAQSMIETVKIQKTIRELQQYNSTTLLFQERFKYLPGDCPKNLGFVSKFLQYGGGPFVGDGNGYIGNFASPDTYSNSNYAALSPEVYNYWAWLEQAGHIPPITTRTGTWPPEVYSAGISSPTPPIFVKRDNGQGNIGGGWWIIPIDGNANDQLTANFTCKNAFTISQGMSGGYYTGGITTSQAAAIDAKLDDGMPQSGNIAASGNYFQHIVTNQKIISPTMNPGAVNCLDSSTPKKYNISYTGYSQVCGLVICSDF